VTLKHAARLKRGRMLERHHKRKDLAMPQTCAPAPAPAPAASADANARFLILDIKSSDGRHRRRVYLLNPGDSFAGFGGSRSSLPIRKTASLIVRDTDANGQRDFETDITDKAQWEYVRRSILFSVGMSEEQVDADAKARGTDTL
jgi:hypothetical protein